MSRCADVIDGSNVAALTELLTSALTHDEHHLARVAMRRHYFDDLQIGDSTARFLEAVSELVTLRDELIGAGVPPENGSETATA